MATSTNARLQIEGGVTAKPMTAMTDAGDYKTFSVPGAAVWSGDEDYEPVIRPNGITAGRNLISVNSTNDTVSTAAFQVAIGGTIVSVSASSVAITRPATDVAKINAICVDASGTISAEAGTDGSSATFSETYGAAGGPPIIDDDLVMIGQVRVTTSAAGAIAETEIFQAVGVHNEYSNVPSWDINAVGDGDQDAETTARQTAHIVFSSALPQIHTSGSKPVYGQVYVPVFTDVARAVDYVPSEYSFSGSSEDYYGGAVNSASRSLSQASFAAMLSDGVTDEVLRRKNKTTTVKFYPDRNKSPYMLMQGKVGITRSYPTASQNRAEFTVTTEKPAADFAD